jgi:hypothetical protein
MLEGIDSHEIVVGAYQHGDGICPMLAAHRHGGRTSCISFAQAWDRSAFRGTRGGKARQATERELLILRAHLEASLLEDEAPAADLRTLIDRHRQLRHHDRDGEAEADGTPRRQRARRPQSTQGADQQLRPPDADRSPELRERPGEAWMRVVRRYDDYQRALARLEARSGAVAEPEAAPDHAGV